jgi:asparagine synthase (glutamine-hydrolysing)
MRRLSIIDVAGGHQPITTEDGRYSIVFNGEIYNHLELRAELGKAGRAFRTRSDTETLLLAFVHWHDDAWLRLEGMYAAAIWDRAERVLTLARDPLGIKPLYLTEQAGGLAFASELRALRVLPGHRFDIDERAVHDFFSFGHVQKPRSIYQQVQSLEPGNVLPSRSDRRIDATRVLAAAVPDPRRRERAGLDRRDARARLAHGQAAHARRRACRCVLSGGVDSGAVTAAMTRATSHRIKAFTIGFPHSAIDETDAARRFAEHLGCEHIVLPMQPMAAAEIFPAVQRSFDEPCAATAAVPIWYLSRLAAQHVKGRPLRRGRRRALRRLQAPAHRGDDESLSSVHPCAGTGGPAHRPAAALIVALVELSPSERVALSATRRCWRAASNVFRRYPDHLARSAGAPLRSRAVAASGRPDGFARLEAEYFGDPEMKALSPLQQFLLADLTVHMPGSLLNRLDRASMAHSLEARVPFLSHQFVDWSLTIPLEMKLKGKVGKYVLRKAAEPWLPPGAMDKRKLGFQLPFAEWFRGDFSDFAREAWHDSGAAQTGYLVDGEVDAIAREHRAGKANYGRILYAIIMFSCWWQDQQRMPASEVEARAPVSATARRDADRPRRRR